MLKDIRNMSRIYTFYVTELDLYLHIIGSFRHNTNDRLMHVLESDYFAYLNNMNVVLIGSIPYG